MLSLHSPQLKESGMFSMETGTLGAVSPWLGRGVWGGLKVAEPIGQADPASDAEGLAQTVGMGEEHENRRAGGRGVAHL